MTLRAGIATDHEGFVLKTELVRSLRASGCDVQDFGAHRLVAADDHPDVVLPLERAIAPGELARGIALCNARFRAPRHQRRLAKLRAIEYRAFDR